MLLRADLPEPLPQLVDEVVASPSKIGKQTAMVFAACVCVHSVADCDVVNQPSDAKLRTDRFQVSNSLYSEFVWTPERQ